MKRIGSVILILFAIVCGDGCRRNSGKKDALPVFRESDILYTKKPDVILEEIKPKPKEKDEPIDDNKNKNDEIEASNKRKADTLALGVAFNDFLRNTKPFDCSLGEFKTYLRRQNKLELRNDVDAEKYTILFLCEPSSFVHVLVYNKQADEGMLPAFEGGPRGSGLSSIKEDTMERRVKDQELEAMLKHYRDYAAKNPAEPRSLDAFKKYLKEKSPPDFLKAVEERQLRINLNARLDRPTDLVVSQGAKTNSGKGTLAVTSSGAVNEYDDITMAQWFGQK